MTATALAAAELISCCCLSPNVYDFQAGVWPLNAEAIPEKFLAKPRSARAVEAEALAGTSPSSSASSSHSSSASCVPAHLLNAPVLWRPAPPLVSIGLIRAPIEAPILPLMTISSCAPRLNKDGTESKRGKRKRLGGLLTFEAAVVEGKEKDAEKKRKADSKEEKTRAVAEKKREKETKEKEKKQKKAETHAEKRKKMEEAASAKVMALLVRVGKLSLAKPSVRGSPSRGLTPKQVDEERAESLAKVRYEWRLARAALEELRSLPRGVNPEIAADAAAMAAAPLHDVEDGEHEREHKGERKDEIEEKGDEKRGGSGGRRGGGGAGRDGHGGSAVAAIDTGDSGDEAENEGDDSDGSDASTDDEEHSHRPRRPRSD